MEKLLNNPSFRADYDKLKDVRLNPARHAAATAYEHCEMVAARAVHLAALNGCTAEETQILANLAHAHDIGKIGGTANPQESVELLPHYGITDEGFIALVKYHDTNLPWYISVGKGQPPSDKAWRKLASKVDMRLLCLFMVADRVDCPGGWQTNGPLVWFLGEVKNRHLLSRELVLDDGPTVAESGRPVVENSAGAALVRQAETGLELLVIRPRSAGYELPKGRLEWDEVPERAAMRELKEETGLLSIPILGELLGTLEYAFESGGVVTHKRVQYYRCMCAEPESGAVRFGEFPPQSRELRWVKNAEVASLPLVSENLRPILYRALVIPGCAPPAGTVEQTPGS